jgi:curved DNA-binding protein CbpA
MRSLVAGMSESDYKTAYEALGVPDTATAEEIKAAYKRLIQDVHPDKLPNASTYWKREAEEKTQEVNEAYSVLKDPEKRRKYDKLLAKLREDSKPKPAPPRPKRKRKPKPKGTAIGCVKSSV